MNPPVDVYAQDVLVIASVSSGADSSAASLELRDRGIAHERVFADTKWESHLSYEYLRGPLTAALGEIAEVGDPLGFEGLVRKKGIFPARNKRFCTEYLKVEPLRDYVLRRAEETGKEIVNVVGIRAAESQARAKMTEWEWSDAFDCWVWRPLIAWTRDDVDAIHARHGLAKNPLYALGASRVGCWPCIHERKAGIVVVADHDPDRIDLIRRMQTDLNVAGQIKDAERGRDWIPRTMFTYHGHDNAHIPLTIDETIAWARSGRGEFQPPNVSDGCARFGMCSVEPEDAM